MLFSEAQQIMVKAMFFSALTKSGGHSSYDLIQDTSYQCLHVVSIELWFFAFPHSGKQNK
jgi:hypothetical protein